MPQALPDAGPVLGPYMGREAVQAFQPGGVAYVAPYSGDPRYMFAELSELVQNGMGLIAGLGDTMRSAAAFGWVDDVKHCEEHRL